VVKKRDSGCEVKNGDVVVEELMKEYRGSITGKQVIIKPTRCLCCRGLNCFMKESLLL